MILRSRQFSDADSVTPKYIGSNFSRIVAGTENNDSSVWEMVQETLKVTVCRHEDQIPRGGMTEDSAIATSGKPVAKCTL